MAILGHAYGIGHILQSCTGHGVAKENKDRLQCGHLPVVPYQAQETRDFGWNRWEKSGHMYYMVRQTAESDK